MAWYRRAEFTLGPVDDVRALETLLREVAAGWVHLYEPAPRPVYTHRLPDTPRAPQPPVPLAVDEIVDTNRSLLLMSGRVVAIPR